MSDMRLIVTGAGGRMGRMLVKTIAETEGVTLAGALESGACAEDFGGLLSLQMALAVVAPPPELPLALLDPLLLLLLPEPHAARAKTEATPSAATEIVDLRIFAPFRRAGAARAPT